MAQNKKRHGALALGALGVVFGDIGTSPLYAVRALFSLSGSHRPLLNPEFVYGLVSLIIWSIFLAVTVKFVLLIMRADNHGEGGMLALVSIIKESVSKQRTRWLLVGLGLIGMALFYGDSAITPAISVLSAVEGLKVVSPGLSGWVIPVTLLIIVSLFWLQKYGTNMIGHLFGPIMLVWFITIAMAGGWQVARHPAVLITLSPATAVTFFAHHPAGAFLAMGAVVLAITGAEALYADLGHFGRRPISHAWFWVVFPALILCYMGQGALLLHQPGALSNPFFYLFPTHMYSLMVVLATLATLIASQSVISGAFSITRQAMHLDFLPKLYVQHTSNRLAGQIYMPFVNYVLFVSVILLVLFFGSSTHLANAYGVAVSGTLAVDTLLFLAVLRSKWHKPWALAGLIAILLVPLDLLFLTSNLAKVVHGGLVPLLLGLGIYTLVNTWMRGQRITTQERRSLEGLLTQLVQDIRRSKSLKRFPGEAVYVGHHHGYAPLALRTTFDELHELPDKILIISVVITNAAHVPEEERAEFNDLGDFKDGISHLKLTYGYHDPVNIPRALTEVHGLSPELDIDPAQATYYISDYKLVTTRRHNLAAWRKALYRFMERNSLSHSDYYKLPLERTQEISSLIKL